MKPEKILPIVIVTLIIGTFLGYHLHINYISPVATEKIFDNYAESYLDTYNLILENSNLSVENKEHFAFYNGYPYSYIVTKSTKKGAMIQYVPQKTVEESQFFETQLPIEDYICTYGTHNPDLAQSIRDSESKIIVSGAILNPNSAMTTLGIPAVILSGTPIIAGVDLSNNYVLIEKNSLVHFDYINYINIQKFATEGCFNLTGTLIDENLNLIIESSNLKDDWSREQAEKDAIDLLIREQLFILVEQSRISGEGYSEISSLVQTYLDNKRKGVYDGYSIAESDDLKIIDETCTYYGYNNNLTRELESLKQKAYYEESKVDEFNKGVNYLSKIGLFFTALLVISFVVMIPVAVYNHKYGKTPLKESIINYMHDIIPGLETFIEAFSILKTRK
ncbi:hypothetical protein [Methanolobus bombayensis]|uniref:hypothetical protein n=1 Tax=Methanolobus bombayensis TaxID=38023 RepID=UPI001AE2FF23|nr:hypothetical protein [Methanolobus bombayensis]MBP1910101.1 hypothetical protein [Methanolobus bombayensis]